MDKRVFWVWLSQILGAGTKTIDILSEYQSEKDILDDLEGFFGRHDLLSPAMRRRRLKFTLKDAEQMVSEAISSGAEILCYDDQNFPARLRDIDDCPLVLYCKGDTSLLSGGVNVGVIGTRKATLFGREQTAKLVSGIIKAGITPVSGFAVGIDEEANITWTAAGAKGIVVIGCGLDINYPARLFKLREEVESRGVVISEFPLGTQPLPGNFPIRNRIIAGLCEGVLVPQAPQKSGALITAHMAIDYGKDLFVVPAAPGNFSTKGNISLLKEGCIIVTEAEDIISRYTEKLFDMDISVNDNKNQDEVLVFSGFQGVYDPSPELYKRELSFETDANIDLTDEQKKVMSHLSGEPIHIDEISARCGISTQRLFVIITTLEMNGYVQSHIGKKYTVKI